MKSTQDLDDTEFLIHTNLSVEKRKELKDEIKLGSRIFVVEAVYPCGKTAYIDMVNTYDDYKNRIKEHVYFPLLLICSFELQVAYLYDCLNRSYGQKREEVFVISTRKKNTSIKEEWFTVKPYDETV